MGEASCDHLFGPHDESGKGTHLFSPSNGLPMHRHFERALDSGRIIIVPALKGDRDPESGKVEWRDGPEAWSFTRERRVACRWV
jgi:hypothetical protein